MGARDVENAAERAEDRVGDGAVHLLVAIGGTEQCRFQAEPRCGLGLHAGLQHHQLFLTRRLVLHGKIAFDVRKGARFESARQRHRPRRYRPTRAHPPPPGPFRS